MIRLYTHAENPQTRHIDKAIDVLRDGADGLVEVIRDRIEERGWLGDHYALLLERGGELVQPWSGETVVLDEIPDAGTVVEVSYLAVGACE